MTTKLKGLTYGWRAGCLVRDDLDALDVASRLEDLAQNILRDTGIQSTNIQRPLVGLGRGTA